MSLERRDFLKYATMGAIATTLRPSSEQPQEAAPKNEQKIDRDFRTNNPGVEYYLVGNGRILAAIQTAPTADAGTHCGLLFMSSEHFARKMSTYLFHPERGLQNTRFTALIDGKGYTPEYGKSKVHWEFPDRVPTIVIEWEAGNCTVREELMCPIDDAALVRTVTIQNTSSVSVNVSGVILLYPNLMLFDDYHVDRERGTLSAMGYETMEMFCLGEATPGDRHLNVKFGEIPAGGKKSSSVVLTLSLPRAKFEKKGLPAMMRETKKYWGQRAVCETNHDGLNHLFNSAVRGLRAAVAKSGKMDAGIWQYNFEWVRDQSMITIGSVLSGHTDVAEISLRRILDRSIDEEGRARDASRQRPAETAELDQNGQLLYALWTHWVWTGDQSIVKHYWPKIRAVANYVLKPEFLDPATGLVKNSREFWERDPAFGVKEGYEHTYQVWNIVGLQAAADLARQMKDSASAKKWLEASSKMKSSFLNHPKYSFVDEGVFIKRRLMNGEVQKTFEPPNRKSMAPGVPLNVEKVSYCDPDSGNVYPIILGLIDPKNPVSTKTLESMELLWNQRWTTGGYARYNVTSEPDSPGAWPFPTMLIVRANFEAGNDEKVWRGLNWLLKAPGGEAGAWFECYADRPVPPLPPLGIVPWTWAEMVMFVVHHLVGVRPSRNELAIRPRLLSGLSSVKTSLVVRGHTVDLTIGKAEKEPSALVNGKNVPLVNGQLKLPLPQQRLKIEMKV
ncbi:MAG: hypothetical protein ABSE41_10115 [Bacteroidota bacterium]|jgi:hypothetical protein